jgi:MYXO-CTERM domain-containing protein
MLSNRLAKHFAAAAAVTVVAGAANAGIVHWADANLVIPNNIDGMYINVETRATGSAGSGVAGWDLNPYSATSLTWFNATGTGMLRYPGVTTGSAGNLTLGTAVGATGSYGSGAVVVGSAAGNWQLNASNYFGFRFLAADGLTHYGWGRFVIGASISGADRMIAEIAYEDAAGASINVGAVPAPGAVALLGLAGLAARRRR